MQCLTLVVKHWLVYRVYQFLRKYWINQPLLQNCYKDLNCCLDVFMHILTMCGGLRKKTPDNATIIYTLSHFDGKALWACTFNVLNAQQNLHTGKDLLYCSFIERESSTIKEDSYHSISQCSNLFFISLRIKLLHLLSFIYELPN